ncbi:MAG: ECF transporter S component [Clostridia bacterium]|nr:ECF transporter S component [Clostridia bacterium]
MEKKNTIYKIATTSIFAALVFVSNMISVPIPVAIGDVSRIHFGNIFCLLSGLVLGGLQGGLAAGIGSFLYDLTIPAYIASSPFTFVFKFLLAFTAGALSRIGDKNGEKFLWNLLSCTLGQVVYIVLYLSKSFFQGLLEGSAPMALIPSIVTKLTTSSINAVIAIIISIPLSIIIRKALVKSKLLG